MNSTSILEQFVIKGKGVTAQGKVLSIIIIIITAIALLGLVAYFGITASVPSIAGTGSSLLTENPELNLVRRFEQVAASSEGFVSEYPNPELVFASRFGPNWVVNPELNLLQGYAGSVEPVSLYPNPELMFAQKFAKNWVVNPEMNLVHRFAGSSAPITQYPNPELMLAAKFAAASAPVTQYGNPELMVAGRYAVSSVLVTQYPNPELMLANKLAAARAPVTQYQNPELALAQRYAVEVGAGFTQWVLNPELSIVQRFMQDAYNGTFLATNPEIKVHLQYVNGG